MSSHNKQRRRVLIRLAPSAPGGSELYVKLSFADNEANYDLHGSEVYSSRPSKQYWLDNYGSVPMELHVDESIGISSRRGRTYCLYCRPVENDPNPSHIGKGHPRIIPPKKTAWGEGYFVAAEETGNPPAHVRMVTPQELLNAALLTNYASRKIERRTLEGGFRPES
jgi:hypothetical protein